MNDCIETIGTERMLHDLCESRNTLADLWHLRLPDRAHKALCKIESHEWAQFQKVLKKNKDIIAKDDEQDRLNFAQEKAKAAKIVEDAQIQLDTGLQAGRDWYLSEYNRMVDMYAMNVLRALVETAVVPGICKIITAEIKKRNAPKQKDDDYGLRHEHVYPNHPADLEPHSGGGINRPAYRRECIAKTKREAAAKGGTDEN